MHNVYYNENIVQLLDNMQCKAYAVYVPLYTMCTMDLMVPHTRKSLLYQGQQGDMYVCDKILCAFELDTRKLRKRTLASYNFDFIIMVAYVHTVWCASSNFFARIFCFAHFCSVYNYGL